MCRVLQLCLFLLPALALAQTPLTERIRDAARNEAAGLAPPGSRLQLSGPDSRLRLSPCTEALLAARTSGNAQAMTIAVRCGSQWTVHVPVRVEADWLVRRGEIITLSSLVGGIAVRVAAKALADGALGSRIPVQNLSSKRVLTATVLGAGEAGTGA